MTEKSPKRTPEGEIMEQLIVEIAATFFRMRAVGSQIGAVTPSGSGYWGLMRSLKVEGPQTVPQLARSRPVSRQHIQKLVNEMLKEGTIDAIANPAHKRSKLLRLTPKGEEIFEELTDKIANLAENLAGEMDLEPLQTTLAVLQRLHHKMGNFSQLDDEVS